jgi:hypothetical protein
MAAIRKERSAHLYSVRESLDRPRRHVIERADGSQGAYASRGRGERLRRGAGHQTRGYKPS